jgi:hypothetical protein
VSVEYTWYRVGSVPGSKQESPTDDDDTHPASFIDQTRRRLTRRRLLRYGLRKTDGTVVQLEIRRIADFTEDTRIPERIAETIGVPLRHVEI